MPTVYDAAVGYYSCMQYDTIVEENTIVADVVFGETSDGAAIVLLEPVQATIINVDIEYMNRKVISISPQSC